MGNPAQILRCPKINHHFNSCGAQARILRIDAQTASMQSIAIAKLYNSAPLSSWFRVIAWKPAMAAWPVHNEILHSRCRRPKARPATTMPKENAVKDKAMCSSLGCQHTPVLCQLQIDQHVPATVVKGQRNNVQKRTRSMSTMRKRPTPHANRAETMRPSCTMHNHMLRSRAAQLATGTCRGDKSKKLSTAKKHQTAWFKHPIPLQTTPASACVADAYPPAPLNHKAIPTSTRQQTRRLPLPGQAKMPPGLQANTQSNLKWVSLCDSLQILPLLLTFALLTVCNVWHEVAVAA